MDKVPVGTKKGGRLLQPPTPIVRAGNWPTLEIKKTTLEDLSSGEDYEEEDTPTGAHKAGTATWDDDFAADDADAGEGAASADDAFDMGDEDDMWASCFCVILSLPV